MKNETTAQPHLPGLQPGRVDWIEVANRMPPVPGDEEWEFDDPDGRSPMGVSIYDCA